MRGQLNLPFPRFLYFRAFSTSKESTAKARFNHLKASFLHKLVRRQALSSEKEYKFNTGYRTDIFIKYGFPTQRDSSSRLYSDYAGQLATRATK